MWMIAALLAAAPVAAEEPLAAAGKWQIDYGESACTASRVFGDGARKVEVLIERTPFGIGTPVFVIIDAKAAPKAYRGAVSLAGEPGEVIASDGVGSNDLADGRRVLRLYMPADYVKSVAGATSLRVVGAELHVPALRLDGMANLASVLAGCERTFAKDIGIDAAAIARIVVPATPIKSSQVLQADDYPHEAIRRDQEGDSYILWRVDTNGRAQDCRLLKSSGHELLDRKACAVVMERGRFVPAYDAAGVAVDGYLSRAVRWRLPTH